MSTPTPPQKSSARIHGRRPRGKRTEAKPMRMSGRILRISADAVAASLAADRDRASFA